MSTERWQMQRFERNDIRGASLVARRFRSNGVARYLFLHGTFNSQNAETKSFS